MRHDTTVSSFYVGLAICYCGWCIVYMYLRFGRAIIAAHRLVPLPRGANHDPCCQV